MDFEKILNLGVEKNIINETQRNGLIDLYYQNNNEPKQVSTVVKVLYYIGGFIMLGAMTALMSDTIQHSTYAMILMLGTIYAVLFLGVGEFLWRKNEKLPAGILYFLFIAAVGFIVMDIEKMTGFFPHFSDMDKLPNYWDLCRCPVIVLSALTIIANTILQKFRPASLLAVPTIFCSYAIFMTIFDFIYGWKNITDKIFFTSNVIFGAGLSIIGFIKDRLTKADYSMWMYLVGAAGFFMYAMFLLDALNIGVWQTQLVCFILSLIYIFIGLMIQRKPFSIIGIMGVIEYIMYFEFDNIKNHTTLLTSVVLITGLIILYAGVIYSKNVDKLRSFIESKLPEKVRNYLPQNRA